MINMKLIRRASGFVDIVEAGAVGVLGTALFVGITVVLPFQIIVDLWSQGLVGVALISAAAALVVLLMLERDVLKRRWSMLTTLMAATWVLCLLTAFVVLG